MTPLRQHSAVVVDFEGVLLSSQLHSYGRTAYTPPGGDLPPLSMQIMASCGSLLAMAFISCTLLAHLRQGRAPRRPRTIAAARPILYGHLPGAPPEYDEPAPLEEIELLDTIEVVHGVCLSADNPHSDSAGLAEQASGATPGASHEHSPPGTGSGDSGSGDSGGGNIRGGDSSACGDGTSGSAGLQLGSQGA
jgi:uncharacterized membrane protein YgcG